MTETRRRLQDTYSKLGNASEDEQIRRAIQALGLAPPGKDPHISESSEEACKDRSIKVGPQPRLESLTELTARRNREYAAHCNREKYHYHHHLSKVFFSRHEEHAKEAAHYRSLLPEGYA